MLPDEENSVLNPQEQRLKRAWSQLVLVPAVLQPLDDVSLALSFLEPAAACVQSRVEAVVLEAVVLHWAV